jgi:hypothetical protein
MDKILYLIIVYKINTEGHGLAEVKSRWVGTYNGAGEFGEEEKTKGRRGLQVKSQKWSHWGSNVCMWWEMA